jgi:predicted phosphodiesterase
MLGFIAPTGKTVEERFKESQSWNETKGEIIIHAKENYTFYDCSDIHVEKTIQNLSKFVDIVQNDTLAAFGFFDGDLINERGAFSTFYSVFKDNINYRPFLASVGNHDLYFEQWEDYVKYFNSSTYSFVIKTSSAKDFYIVLDTGSATIGSSQLKWLKNKLKERNDYRHCIIFTHTSFFLTDNSQTTTGSLALEETYELMNLFSENNVDLVISGHDHSYGIDNFNGVTYITTSLLKDDSETASYLKVNVDENLNFKNTKI